MYIYDSISLNFTQSRKFLRQMYRENQNTLLVNNYPPPGNGVVYGIIWENGVEPERPQMTI
jgi:hypothetical protein